MSFISLKSSTNILEGDRADLFTNNFTEGIFVNDKSTLSLNSITINVDTDDITINELNNVFYWQLANNLQMAAGGANFHKITIPSATYDSLDTLATAIQSQLQKSSVLFQFRGLGATDSFQFEKGVGAADNKYTLKFEPYLLSTLNSLYNTWTMMEDYPNVEFPIGFPGQASVLQDSIDVNVYNDSPPTANSHWSHIQVNPNTNPIFDGGGQELYPGISPYVWLFGNEGMRNHGGVHSVVVPGIVQSTNGVVSKQFHPPCVLGLLRQQQITNDNLANNGGSGNAAQFIGWDGSDQELDFSIIGEPVAPAQGVIHDYRITIGYVNRLIPDAANPALVPPYEVLETFLLSTKFGGAVASGADDILIKFQLSSTNSIEVGFGQAAKDSTNRNWQWVDSAGLILGSSLPGNLLEINYPYIPILGMDFVDNQPVLPGVTNVPQMEFYVSGQYDDEHINSLDPEFQQSPQNYYDLTAAALNQPITKEHRYGKRTIKGTVSNVSGVDEFFTTPSVYQLANMYSSGQIPILNGYLVRKNVIVESASYLLLLAPPQSPGTHTITGSAFTYQKGDYFVKEHYHSPPTELSRHQNSNNAVGALPPAFVPERPVGDMVLFFRELNLDVDFPVPSGATLPPRPPSWVQNQVTKNANTTVVLGYTQSTNNGAFAPLPAGGFIYLDNYIGPNIPGADVVAESTASASQSFGPSVLVELLDFPGLLGYTGGNAGIARTIDIIPKEQFVQNQGTIFQTLSYNSNVVNPVRLNLATDQVLYSIKVRLRGLNGEKLEKVLRGSTEIVLFLENQAYKQDFQRYDRYLTDGKSATANREENKISNVNDAEYMKNITTRYRV